LNGSSKAFVLPDYPNEPADPPCARELSRFNGFADRSKVEIPVDNDAETAGLPDGYH
jgi:hypothetical protein